MTIKIKVNDEDIEMSDITSIEQYLIDIRKQIYPLKVNVQNITNNESINDICNKLNIGTSHVHAHTKFIKQIYHSLNTNGFGDFINGCIFLYVYCKQTNTHFQINYSDHIINNFLYSQYETSNNEIKLIESIYDIQHINKLNYINFVYCNGIPLKDVNNNFIPFDKYLLSDDCRDFIKSNIQPRIKFLNNLNSFKKTHGFYDYTYNVIHVRLNDNLNNNNDTYNIIYNQINNIICLNKLDINNTLLISSSKSFLNKINIKLKQTNLDIDHTSIYHSLDKNNHENNIHNTLIEFFLMSTAKKIYQLSSYSWGSHFSNVINYIYNVPIIRYDISRFLSLIVFNPKNNKIRLGCNSNGGYVIIDNLSYDHYISCGIGDNVSFDIDFLEKNPDIHGSLFDGSIENLPQPIKNVTFYRENISNTLDSLLSLYNNIFLKIDIEGREYNWLTYISNDQLKNIKQLLLNFTFRLLMNTQCHR